MVERCNLCGLKPAFKFREFALPFCSSNQTEDGSNSCEDAVENKFLISATVHGMGEEVKVKKARISEGIYYLQDRGSRWMSHMPIC